MQFACPALLPAIERGDVVVTPTPFLAAIAAHQFTRDQLAKDAGTWKTPEILSASAWLRQRWTQARYTGADLPVLLSGAQEHLLWRRIIEAETPGLFDSGNAARLASRAARLIEEWDIPLEHDAWTMHQDGRQFKKWLTEFGAKCRQEGWTSEAALWKWIPSAFGRHVAFVGFSGISPSLRRLGIVAKRDLPASVAAESVYRGTDLPEELKAVARSLRAALEQQPRISIGVFVPDLAPHRTLVERTIEEVFYSAARAAGRRTADSVFHMNAAAPLSEHPLIAGARLLLELTASHLPIADASAILRSPWIGGAQTERDMRAIADLALRRLRELDVRFSDLQWCAKTCPDLARCLQQVWFLLRDKPVLTDCGRWSEFFNDVLAALRWPGDKELAEREHDLVDMWKDKLSRLASLTLISGKVTIEDALARLDSLLQEGGLETGDFFSPIQIIDASEAHGLRFDRSFVVGLCETQAFFARRTSPLVPLQLQRACDLPGATAASALQHERETVSNLFRSAPRIVASYSDRVHPAAQAFLASAHAESSAWEGKIAKQAFTPADLERIPDSNAPPYCGDGHSLGGTGLLKDQSQCPFRAFAIRRLHARSPEEGSFGMDARDRGGFAHAALKLVWDELRTQERLRHYPPLLIPSLVRDAVEEAVRTHGPGPLHEQLSIAEKERLIQVVLDWLEVEAARSVPFTVEKTEEKCVLEIGRLRLDVRIDRVDRLANGKAVLIDYKSGKASPANLNGDRPKEPQLLAYASNMPDEVDGFFFGQLKPRDAKLVGFARQKHSGGQNQLPKAVKWDDYLEDRLEVVEHLAESFLAGEAAVDPLKGACEYCDVGPFCRIREVRLARSEEANDE